PKSEPPVRLPAIHWPRVNSCGHRGRDSDPVALGFQDKSQILARQRLCRLRPFAFFGHEPPFALESTGSGHFTIIRIKGSHLFCFFGVRSDLISGSNRDHGRNVRASHRPYSAMAGPGTRPMTNPRRTKPGSNLSWAL